jgi:hypothetical protein
MPLGTLRVRIGIVRKRDKRKFRHFSVHQRRRHKSIVSFEAPRYFSRRLFVTTVTLDSAIAAEATMGESKPKAAIGIPSVL